MFSLALLAVSALLFTLAFTPVCRTACIRLGWVDQPGPRKVHQAPVPRTGGIAILFAYALAFLILFYSPLGGARAVAAALPSVWALLPAVLVAFATGLLDDVFGLKPWMKILGQIIAAALACNANVQIHAVAGHSIASTWWHVPITILWLVACSNAFNLIDGLDGLAVGVGLCATATIFLSATLSGNYALALVTAPLLGALLGFLPYNVNPASIFMGDCGSLTVGFLLGCFGVIWSQKSATLLGMTAPLLALAAPLLALAIPLLDTSLAIARRFLRGEPTFCAARAQLSPCPPHLWRRPRPYPPSSPRPRLHPPPRRLCLLCRCRNCRRSLPHPGFRRQPRRRHRPRRLLCLRLARCPIPWI